ncbi:heterokaryon incompatibility protein-domain-containing protein [Ilyonectria robusta]|uniref:heterokaryon incompatibility protein-domain-containing protein n=1 Tax=Ilyonectria robusta TaxID=1079257 RepID=UPI001E8D88F6|nr:heterokaryon incompatibility protein-domain-containing protein [Ilyonectria robusta]KAH8736574.1 heterokaryon incompatibility protein-domain-containing protein [Ilyonectria robusta]
MDHLPKLGAYSSELQKALYPRPLRLGETRLLSFVSLQDSVLHCKLRPLAATTDDTSPIPYHALSYVWGNRESDLQRMVLNDQHILITQNLHAALCAIWSSAPRPHIWADALCINQYDNDEKNVQVTRMHHIYSMASCVRVWLGEMTPPVEAMLPYLPEYDRLGDTSYTDNSGYGDWSCSCLGHTGPTSRPKEVCLHRRPNCLKPGDPALDMWAAVLYGLNDLLSRQWFARAWTMQEAILARKAIMHFGSHSMQWDDFRIRCSKTDGSGLQIRNYLVREVFAAQGAIEKRVYSMSQFLVLGWPRECFDPKDKVFSLFGLLPEMPFKVDYSRSLRDVYIAATRACIATEKNLRVLSAAGLSGNAGGEMGECDESSDAAQPEQCKWFGNCSHSNGHCQPGGSQISSIQREFPSWVTDWRAEGCKQAINQTDWYMTVANIDTEHIGRAIALQQVDDSSGCLLLTGITLGRFSTHKSFKRYPIIRADGSVSTYGWRSFAGAFVEFPPCTAKIRDEGDHALSNLSPFSHAVHQHDVGKCDCTEEIRQNPLNSIYSVGVWEHHKLCTDGDWLCILDGAAAPFILRPDRSPLSTKQCSLPKSAAFTLVGGMRISFVHSRGQYGELLNAMKEPLGTYLGQAGEARIISEKKAKETLERTGKEDKSWYSDAIEGRRPVKGVGGVFHLH